MPPVPGVFSEYLSAIVRRAAKFGAARFAAVRSECASCHTERHSLVRMEQPRFTYKITSDFAGCNVSALGQCNMWENPVT